MEEQASHIETLFERTEHYTRTSVELYKLKAIDKSADVLSTLVARIAVAAFVILFFLILNIGVALWLGELLGRSCYGFFTVAGFYALAGIAIYVFRRRWIETPLRNAIITQAMS
jgi:hypothetical protein